jgi:hypothetical protein
MSEYAGMTVNERLYACGLLDDFGVRSHAATREMIEI